MTDKEFLQWIYDRMITLHGYNPNLDYMHKFHGLITEMNDYVNQCCPTGTSCPGCA